MRYRLNVHVIQIFFENMRINWNDFAIFICNCFWIEYDKVPYFVLGYQTKSSYFESVSKETKNKIL